MTEAWGGLSGEAPAYKPDQGDIGGGSANVTVEGDGGSAFVTNGEPGGGSSHIEDDGGTQL